MLSSKRQNALMLEKKDKTSDHCCQRAFCLEVDGNLKKSVANKK